MQNNPSSADEPGNIRPAQEREQDDSTLLTPSSAFEAAEATLVSSDQEPVQAPPASPLLPESQGTPDIKVPQQGPVPVTPPSTSPSAIVPVTPQPPLSPRYFPPSEYIPVSDYATPGEALPSSYISPQPGYVQPEQTLPPRAIQQQDYILSQQVPSPGAIPQPGYIPPRQMQPPGVIPQPGYIPPRQMQPPGYVPGQATPLPGVIPQPGYVPAPQMPPPRMVSQPGYVPAPQTQPPAPQPPRARRQVGVLVIGGVAMAIVIILSIVLVSVSLSRRGSSNPTATVPPISPSPTTALGQPTTAFEAAPCPFSADPALIQPQNQQLSCGYVTVPQERGVKNGLTVRLAVAIFKASEYMNSVDPAPVIRLDGGPGGPSLSDLAQYITKSNYHTFIFHHDVVMFDQRGTGYSTPSLNCPELNNTSSNSAYEQGAHTCYNRLVAQGIDLNGFNSLQNAGDVADIIHALGYKQMTVYGVSYGTRLALTTMRLYPAVVRAAVLDSVYPPNDNRTQLPSDAQRAFDVLFQGCAKNPICTQKYPDLQHVFYALVDQLNAKPISFETVDATTNHQYTITFAGDDLISWVFSVLYVTQLIPVIPQVIYQIKARNYTQLATIYGEIMFDDTLSAGFFYSAECSEDWPFLTQQSIAQSEQGIEPHLAKVFGQEGEQQEYNICQFWKVQQVPAAQKQPVVSSIPSLITTGEYDPITPPANGQDAAKTLSNSYFFEFPGQGHGQEYSSFCSNQVISAFEDNPQVKPDGSCISQMAEPQFV